MLFWILAGLGTIGALIFFAIVAYIVILASNWR